MASSLQPASDGTAQRAAQSNLAVIMAGPLVAAWPMYDPATPSSIDRWIAAVLALVRRYGAASAALAAQGYEDARQGVPGSHRAAVAPPTPEAAVQSAMRWAVHTEDQAVAQKQAIGGATKLALDQGRDTVLANVLSDRKAQAWVRVTRPNACSFCRLLAQRGPVYHSEQSAGFQAHDHCHCFPAPVFAGQKYVMPDHVVADRRLYEESTAGYHGKDALNAFRRAVYAQTKA